MFGRTGAAASHHGNAHGVGHRAGHRQVITGPGAVGIHRRQHNFAGAEFFHLPGPRHGLQACGNPAAVNMDFPEVLTVLANAPWIDIDDGGIAAAIARRWGTSTWAWHGRLAGACACKRD